MLDEDSGEYFRDPNAARDPHFPVEPAIRAVFASHPDFKVAAIDIVGCGSTIGNLLRSLLHRIDREYGVPRPKRKLTDRAD